MAAGRVGVLSRVASGVAVGAAAVPCLALLGGAVLQGGDQLIVQFLVDRVAVADSGRSPYPPPPPRPSRCPAPATPRRRRPARRAACRPSRAAALPGRRRSHRRRPAFPPPLPSPSPFNPARMPCHLRRRPVRPPASPLASGRVGGVGQYAAAAAANLALHPRDLVLQFARRRLRARQRFDGVARGPAGGSPCTAAATPASVTLSAIALAALGLLLRRLSLGVLGAVEELVVFQVRPVPLRRRGLRRSPSYPVRPRRPGAVPRCPSRPAVTPACSSFCWYPSRSRRSAAGARPCGTRRRTSPRPGTSRRASCPAESSLACWAALMNCALGLGRLAVEVGPLARQRFAELFDLLAGVGHGLGEGGGVAAFAGLVGFGRRSPATASNDLPISPRWSFTRLRPRRARPSAPCPRRPWRRRSPS